MFGITRVNAYTRTVGVYAVNVKQIDWISCKLKDKFMYWKSQLWPFHVQLKEVHFIMMAMILYILPCNCCNHFGSCCGVRGKWRLHGFHGIPWLLPNNQVVLEYRNWKHVMARTFALSRDMCQQYQPWISMMQYFHDVKDWCTGKLRFKCSGGHCSMDVFLQSFNIMYVCDDW